MGPSCGTEVAAALLRSMCVREGALSREGRRPAGDSRAGRGVLAMRAHLPGMKSGMHLAPRLSWNCAPQQVAQPSAARVSSDEASTGADSMRGVDALRSCFENRLPLLHDSKRNESYSILVVRLATNSTRHRMSCSPRRIRTCRGAPILAPTPMDNQRHL